MLQLKYDKHGLIPAIIQDRQTGKVLMLGYMNADAYHQTVASGFVTFYSRSRQKLWTKGETSGHRLRAREIRVDCDQDALLVQADLTGPGCCHLGYHSCFFRKLTPNGEKVILKREFNPARVYGRMTRRAKHEPAKVGFAQRKPARGLASALSPRGL